MSDGSPSVSLFCAHRVILCTFIIMNAINFLKNSRKLGLSGLSLCVFLALSTGTTSCKVGEGCGTEDKSQADLSSKKRGKSNLFSKKQRKKMKRRG